MCHTHTHTHTYTHTHTHTTHVHTHRLASNTLSGTFQAWHIHVHQISRLRVILQKVLGRQIEFAFFGWR